jgi:hypothetical protein
MKRAAAAFIFAITALPCSAQSQPPVQSARDAACREEAASRVFSAPNPKGLGLYDVGRQIWQDCMRRADHGRRVHKRSRRSI